MAIGRAWTSGYGREFEIMARALEHAAHHDREALEAFVRRLDTSDDALLAVHAETVMRDSPLPDQTRSTIEANWFGQGGPSMWKATARQRPSETYRVIRAAQAELARRLLASPAKVEVLGQSGYDDAEVWITWPIGAAPAPMLTMWVFVPDNSAHGPGQYRPPGARLGAAPSALVQDLRAKVAERGPANVRLPASGETRGPDHGDPLVVEILDAVETLPRGYPVYLELGLSHGQDDAGTVVGTVTLSGPHESHEPAMDQQAPSSRTNPRGQEVRLVRLGWSSAPAGGDGSRRVAVITVTSA